MARHPGKKYYNGESKKKDWGIAKKVWGIAKYVWGISKYFWGIAHKFGESQKVMGYGKKCGETKYLGGRN